MFKETLDGCFFLKYGFRSAIQKNYKQTLSQVKNVTVQKHFIGSWTVTSNHKVNKYWVSADLLFLIENIMWDGFY